jgi:multimeric flavodoxin WrbA
MAVVGMSGSPIVDGNTDRMVKALLEQSGKDHIFINLSTQRYDPCRACAHLCAGTNLCPLEDDLRPYFEPIRDAEALVLGTPIHAGLITGWMYSFTTRLSCFSHVTHPLEGKPVLLVAVGGFEPTEWMAVSKFGENVVRRSEGVKIIGHIFYASTIPPCYKCGRGNECKVGALWHLVGYDEEKLRNFKPRQELFRRWEDCPETVTKVEAYAKVLSEL